MSVFLVFQPLDHILQRWFLAIHEYADAVDAGADPYKEEGGGEEKGNGQNLTSPYNIIR